MSSIQKHHWQDPDKKRAPQNLLKSEESTLSREWVDFPKKRDTQELGNENASTEPLQWQDNPFYSETTFTNHIDTQDESPHIYTEELYNRIDEINRMMIKKTQELIRDSN